VTAPAQAAPPYLPRDALEPWCAVGATGALRVLDPPGGAIYLDQGRITYAESPPACGLDRLLTASGRLSTEAWRTAAATGRPTRQIGDVLVQRGLLTQFELETAILSALYGAAHFLFEAASEVRFEVGVQHAIGSVVALDLATVATELQRRAWALRDAWPDSTMDDHAVVPARRLPGHHVTLTALQWEIVANADRRRTPVELARSLGRDTYATLLETRRLARNGLVEPGRPGTVVASVRVGRGGRDAPDDTDRDSAEGTDRNSSVHPVDPAGLGDAADGTGVPDGETEVEPGPLPRRESSDAVPPPVRRTPTEPPPAPEWFGSYEECPDDVLVRIRDALVALR
jgi:hypothetical protein